ncbi:hypothetical protein [Serratia marcescens]|uniref:hypothetical protein n=1 Tax=Serratia marcescens TaxID=615 RepID=UPI000D73655C|nr:hypothetical protein [Serratia marcescens]AWQ48050.1 hypothetical protein B1A42_12205 [Serratia marcescens]
MANTETKKLADTYIFTNDKPSRVKYEIYTDSKKFSAQLTIYRVSPLGVQSYDEINLNADVNQPGLAYNEVKQHFEQHYA